MLLDQMATQIEEINSKTKLIETKLDELIQALHELDDDYDDDEYGESSFEAFMDNQQNEG